MTSDISVKDLIRFSWAKTKELLLPFQFKRWLRILLVVWLAGHMAGGLGGGFNWPQSQRNAKQREAVKSAQTAQNKIAVENNLPSDQTTASSPVEAAMNASGASRTDRLNPLSIFQKIPIFFVVTFLLLALIFSLFMMWLGARFNFILLDLIIRRDVAIRVDFKAFKNLGDSYFLWSLAYFSCVIAGIGFCIFLIIYAAPLRWIVVLALIAFIVLTIVVGVLVADFILPMMYQDQLSVWTEIKKFMEQRVALGRLLKYFIAKIGLGILAFISVIILSFVIGAIGVIGILLLVLVSAFFISFATLLKPLIVLIAVLIGTALMLAVIVTIGMVTLPIPIFFRAFELSFLAKLIPNYNLLRYGNEIEIGAAG